MALDCICLSLSLSLILRTVCLSDCISVLVDVFLFLYRLVATHLGAFCVAPARYPIAVFSGYCLAL